MPEVSRFYGIVIRNRESVEATWKLTLEFLERRVGAAGAR